NQIKKFENLSKKVSHVKYSLELDRKLNQMSEIIGKQITENIEVIASNMTEFVDKVVNKAFKKVLSKINKKSSKKALNEVDDNNNYIEEDAKKIIDYTEYG
ncbi:10864_t:CDS:1, partial [Cetraspora pellucida]